MENAQRGNGGAEDFLSNVPLVIPGGGAGLKPADPQEALAEGRALMQTKTEYHTAVKVQEPRVLDKIVAKVLNEAQYAGKEFYYRWMVKDKRGEKKPVEGVTIGAAMTIAREWGNCVIDPGFEDRGSHYLFRAQFIDLETGTTITRVYKARPAAAPGKYDAARWEDMQLQVHQSKALRNVIRAAVPRWLCQAVIEEAKKAELSFIDKVGVAQSRSLALEFFQRLGVEEDQLVVYFDGLPVDRWGKEEIAQLREIGRSIKDGEVSIRELFPEIETAPPKEPSPAGDSQGPDPPLPADQPQDQAGASSEAPAPSPNKKTWTQKEVDKETYLIFWELLEAGHHKTGKADLEKAKERVKERLGFSKMSLSVLEGRWERFTKLTAYKDWLAAQEPEDAAGGENSGRGVPPVTTNSALSEETSSEQGAVLFEEELKEMAEARKGG